jgi:hypothetical protein
LAPRTPGNAKFQPLRLISTQELRVTSGVAPGAPMGEKCSWTIFQSPLTFTNTIVVASFIAIGLPSVSKGAAK